MMRDSQGNIIEEDDRGIWLRDPYTGKRCPYIAGGSGGDEDDVDDDDLDEDNDDDDDDAASARKHTDEDLSRVATRERKQGRRAGRRELMAEIATKLGMTVDEAAAKLAKGPKPGADDGDAKPQVDPAKDHELQQRERRAVVKENTADVVAELITQGLNRTVAKQLAPSVKLELDDPELDDDDIVDAVNDFKELMPQLFGSDDGAADDDAEDEGSKPKDSTSRGKKKSSKPTSAADRARERFLQLHPDRKSA